MFAREISKRYTIVYVRKRGNAHFIMYFQLHLGNILLICGQTTHVFCLIHRIETGHF